MSALLWHTIWDASYTFLHIPKTAGSTISKQDRHSADAAYTLMNQHAGGELRKREGTFRSRCLGTASQRHQCAWRHFSPRLLDTCGFPEDINPYKKRSVYCAMREPRERFLSSFFYSENMAEHGGQVPSAVQTAQSALKTSPDQPDCQFGWHAFMRWSFRTNCWNASTYGAPDTPLNRWRFARKLRCFATYADYVNQRLKAFEVLQVSKLSRPRRGMRAFDLCDSHLHVQSQANYLADAAGEPTCHRVFSTEDVAVAIDMRTNSARPSWQSALGKRMLEADEPLGSYVDQVYKDDLALWKRVSRHEAPTPRHEMLGAAAAKLVAAAPSLAAVSVPTGGVSPPRCTPPKGSGEQAGCACEACCSARLTDTTKCMHCLLAQSSCFGPGVQPKPTLPRELALVCNSTQQRSRRRSPIACNTCTASMGHRVQHLLHLHRVQHFFRHYFRRWDIAVQVMNIASPRCQESREHLQRSSSEGPRARNVTPHSAMLLSLTIRSCTTVC